MIFFQKTSSLFSSSSEMCMKFFSKFWMFETKIPTFVDRCSLRWDIWELSPIKICVFQHFPTLFDSLYSIPISQHPSLIKSMGKSGPRVHKYVVKSKIQTLLWGSKIYKWCSLLFNANPPITKRQSLTSNNAASQISKGVGGPVIKAMY